MNPMVGSGCSDFDWVLPDWPCRVFGERMMRFARCYPIEISFSFFGQCGAPSFLFRFLSLSAQYLPPLLICSQHDPMSNERLIRLPSKCSLKLVLACIFTYFINE